MTGDDTSLYAIKAALILDNEGNRIFAKYYHPPYGDKTAEFANVKDQKTFETGLFNKTNKQNSDVIIYDGNVVVYKQIVDVSIYIVGGLEENEAMLYQVVMGLRDAIELLLHHSVDKRTIFENYGLIALAVDETIDSGIILEVDPSIIAARVSRAPQNEPSLSNIDLSEQGLQNFYQFARGKVAERIRQQFQ